MSKGNDNVKKTRLISSKAVRLFFWSFQIIILLTMIGSIIIMNVNPDRIEQSTSHIILCIVTLLIYNVPIFLGKKIKLEIPTFLQIFALCFIFAHFILGEIFRAYDHVPFFDKTLHVLSGLAFAALGFSLINILNKSDKIHLKFSPGFVVLFAFCFSMAVASVWEVIEFSIDGITGSNMQRWQNDAVLSNAGKAGLSDTMWDMIVCLIGTAVVCVAGYISLKTKNNFLNKIMIRRANIVDTNEFFIKNVDDNEIAKLEKKPVADGPTAIYVTTKPAPAPVPQKPVIVLEPYKAAEAKPALRQGQAASEKSDGQPVQKSEEQEHQEAVMFKIQQILSQENKQPKSSKVNKESSEAKEEHAVSLQYKILKEILESKEEDNKVPVNTSKAQEQTVATKPSNYGFMQLKDIIGDDDE